MLGQQHRGSSRIHTGGVLMSDQSLPPDAVLVSYQVADFDQWKAGFDKNEANRIASRMVSSDIISTGQKTIPTACQSTWLSET